MTQIRPETREMIDALIGFDTTSRNSNLELIHFVQEYLSKHGVDSSLAYDSSKIKANLYATIGPKDIGGVMLSGHTDVVPVDGQDWDSDPFVVEQRGDKLYGRGSCDMKGFVATVLSYVPKFIEADLNIPVHLAFSYDEEVGCMGVHGLIDLINGLPVKPAMCIVGEPTEMQVTVAHKGKLSMRCNVRGLECHSSLAPSGVNAVEYASELVYMLRQMARKFREEGPFDDRFDVPHTTVHTGTIKGGTALNIVPRDCTFEYEFRNLPVDDADALNAEIVRHAEEVLVPEMHKVDPSTGISFEKGGSIRALNTLPEEEVVTLAKALAGRNDEGRVSFGTEAGFFQGHAGVPTVVCGPGSIEQAHKPNEFVSLEQLGKCETFLERLIGHLSAS